MFKDLYKQKTDFGDAMERQENRRRELLAEQKLKRSEFQDEHRDTLIKPVCKKNAQKKRRTFKDVFGNALGLQMSEWMRELPEDMHDWLVVPCPVGQRCLLVAHGGRTEMYNKAGRCLFSFNSMLPGGVRAGSRKDTTILDCVYARDVDKFYVLDVLVFGGQEFVDCDSQFRFFWLQSKFEEHERLSERNIQNEKPILHVKYYDFEYAQQVSEAFQLYPLWPNNTPALDGFLFYHKEASYSCNITTPLVLWLFAFIVPDMLNMEVNSEYATPGDYENPIQYMDMFDSRLAKKRTNIKSQNQTEDSVMDFSSNDGSLLSMDDETTLENLLASERLLELENISN